MRRRPGLQTDVEARPDRGHAASGCFELAPRRRFPPGALLAVKAGAGALWLPEAPARPGPFATSPSSRPYLASLDGVSRIAGKTAAGSGRLRPIDTVPHIGHPRSIVAQAGAYASPGTPWSVLR